MRILIADDNQINREFVRGVLSGGAHEITEAADGREAVERFSEGPFDLILMDLRMPEMDGLEATLAIRRMPSNPTPTIVALTADLHIQQETDLLAKGFDVCLSKPVSRQTLIELTGRLSQPESMAQPTENAELLDSEAALAAAGGNRELVDRLLAMLGKELSAFVPRIRQFSASGDYPAARELVHKLRGSAGYTGAVELVKVTAELELALTRGSATEVAPAVEHLQQAADRLRPLLPDAD